MRLLLCDDIIVFLRPKGTSIGTSGATGGMGGVGMERKEVSDQQEKERAIGCPIGGTLFSCGKTLKIAL